MWKHIVAQETNRTFES